MTILRTVLSAAAALIIANAAFAGGTPLGTTFTYQGVLRAGSSPANGVFDLTFRLFDVPTGGVALGTVSLPDQTITDGLITATLDFGTAAFNGDQRWLEIQVETTTLIPRTSLRAAPYALYALNSGAINIINMPSGGAWSLTSGLNIDATTFHIDPVNNRVGIGTRTPLRTLHVQSAGGAAMLVRNTAATGIADGLVSEATNSNSFGVWARSLATTGGGIGLFAETESATGYAGWFEGGRSYFQGNVGIGTTEPALRLHVTGGADITLAGGGDIVSGSLTGANLVVDPNELQARNNGAAATMFLNFEGGDVQLGNSTSDIVLRGPVTIPETTRYYSIAGGAFHCTSSAYVFSTGSNYASARGLVAAVHLPDDAIVTGFEVHVLDNSNGDMEIALRRTRQATSSASDDMAIVTSSGFGPTILSLTDNTIGFPGIENENYAYFVHSFSDTPDGEHRLYRVRIRYSISAPLP